ncbi:MAG: site-specific integrase [Gemmatimonadota bacterium]|nr:site-specific integrase [Gemmatimonadota bacterium]
MPAKRTSRVYSKNGRFYGDFRDYADVGGKLEALKPPGSHGATTDADIATKLAAARVKDLEDRRRRRHLSGTEQQSTLGAYAERHLELKDESGKVTRDHLEATEHHLRAAVEFFGIDRDLATISPQDVQRWVGHLQKSRSRGRTLSDGTVRKYLNALSNLLRRAVSERYVDVNAVRDLMEKPQGARHEAAWLEIPDAALFLEAARLWRPDPRFSRPNPAMYAIIATLLLTGGRESEVMGLDVEDISFDRRTITFRPNQWRRLKTRTSHRTLRMWPQLEEIMRAYVFGGNAPRSGLLFPSHRANAKTGRIPDTRKSLDAIAATAGWKPGEVRTRVFRTTYATARLQTLDNGAPVAVWTVARELGHASTSMLERIYGKLGQVRHRKEVVEYRVEQHREPLGERLEKLRAM